MMLKTIWITTLAGLLATSLAAWGQSETQTSNDSIKEMPADTISQEEKEDDPTETFKKNLQQINTDTIYFFEREPMFVNVMKITYDSVIYREPETTRLKALGKDRINKIKYNWGRQEILNKKPPKKQQRYDWRKVKILKDKNRASQLYKVKEIKAKAEGSGRGYETPKSLESKARTILRKKAANVNARYVLITKKDIATAFGELPSASLSGIAYSEENHHQQEGSAQEKED